MIRSTARRASAAALIAAAVLAVSGCAAGFEATTTQPYAPADGVFGTSGDIKVLNALVVVPEGGDTGVVSMTVVNDGPLDALVDLTSNGGTVDWSGPRELPRDEAVRLGAGTDPSATLRDLRVQPGDAVTLLVRFANSPPLNLDTVVVLATGPYATITPPPEPLPTLMPVESPTPTPTATTE